MELDLELKDFEPKVSGAELELNEKEFSFRFVFLISNKFMNIICMCVHCSALIAPELTRVCYSWSNNVTNITLLWHVMYIIMENLLHVIFGAIGAEIGI